MVSAGGRVHANDAREIMSHCVWLYFRFGVSFRDVEEMTLDVVDWHGAL